MSLILLVELTHCACLVLMIFMEHLASAGGNSAANRSQPEPRGGSNSEETTNHIAKQYRHAKTTA